MTSLRRPRRRSTNSGFTLLEIMIAMAIMTMAFASILTSQSGAIALTVKTKELNVAGWLVRDAMVEAEHVMEGKPFKELKEEETGTFKDAFQQYKWKRELKELKFPEIEPQAPEGSSGVDEVQRIIAKTITKFLNDSVRELIVTVSWPGRGGVEQQVSLTTYLIDMNAEYNFTL